MAMAVMKSKERASEPDQHECMRVYESVCAAKVDHLKMELILYSTKVSTFKKAVCLPLHCIFEAGGCLATPL